MRDLKRITIHGNGTVYRLTIFRFGSPNDEFWEKTGFRASDYIGAIVWGPDSYLLIDREGGYPPYAVRKTQIYECPVLIAGWEFVLNRFDEIKSGDTLEVKLDYSASPAWKYADVGIRRFLNDILY